MQRLAALLLILFCLPCAGPASAREVLRVLAWPGYADADLMQAFEARFDVTVEVTVVGNDDELWERASANGGANFDVVAVNTAELQRYIDQRLVQPLNLRNIPNTRLLGPRFRKLSAIPGLVRQGQTYALPYASAEMGLIYNPKLVRTPPTSMSALWDPRYRGKVLAYNGSSHNFSLTALALGMKDPFQLNPEQFGRVVNQLRGLRDNVLAYYTKPEEVVELFHDSEVALIFANYGSQQVRMLRKANAEIGYVIPREGALAWLDCWAVLSGTRSKELAESWINYLLSPYVSGQLPLRQGLANALGAVPEGSATDKDRLVWLQPVENYNKRAEYWERLLSGYQKAH